MWEKINKVSAQVIACMIIIIACLALAVLAALNKIPSENQGFITSIVSPLLAGAIGWLYTSNKHQRNSQP